MERTMYATLLGTLTLGLLAGCESAREYLQLRRPTVQLVNVHFREADVYGATLVFDAEIENHYSVAMPLLSFGYLLSSRGERLFAGSSEVAISIPAGGKRTVSLPARVDYLNMLRALGGVRPGATIPYEVQLDVVIKTPQLGPLTLPVSRSGVLVLPEVSDINLGDIRDIVTKPR